MGLFKKKAKQKNDYIDSEVQYNLSGEPLNKLIDGELPWGWVAKYYYFTKPRDTKLYDLCIATRNCKTIEEEIQALEECIDYYYYYKAECKSKGECFYKYFENMHMHCHNSTDKDFETISSEIERLDYIKNNYDKVKKEYEQMKK